MRPHAFVLALFLFPASHTSAAVRRLSGADRPKGVTRRDLTMVFGMTCVSIGRRCVPASSIF